MSSIQWQEWNDEAFEKAKSDNKPVLLLITAAWCRWCKSMEEETFSDPEVIRAVEESFLPIRVDKDRRPDINDRYNMGGWPSSVFLTPEGDVITGGTYFNAKEMALLLKRIAESYRENKGKIEEAVHEMILKDEDATRERPAQGATLNLEIITNVSRSIYREFDEKHGGFGTGQKFAHSEALDFALLQYFKTNDLKLFGVINKTLTCMAEGKLFDRIDGGFFRFCATRDWRSPHTEKLLETNIKLLNNYLDAARVMDRESYRIVAAKTASYICSNLWDENRKAFWGSRDADNDYYELEGVDRQDRKPPQADRTIYANLNANAASVFLKAGAVLDEPYLQDMAVSAIEFLLQNMYVPERGVYHYFDSTRHILGLLSDQIYLCDALLQAVEYLGENRYLDVIRDLIETIVQKQSSHLGGFYDIPPGHGAHGGLTRQNKSILENAVMASVLIRYHYFTFDDHYLQLAERTLKAFAEDYHLYGYFTAGYAKAVDNFFYKPIYVVIMGKKNSPKTDLLRKTATQLYLPSCIAVTIDPDTEPEMVKQMKFPVGRDPKAYICLEQSCHAAVDDPEELKTAIQDLEASRAPHQR
ncbi:MAG: DUF255 domain-containing protein [Planctomycetota bacterium]